MKRMLLVLSLLVMVTLAYAQTPSLSVSSQEAMDTAVTIDSLTLAEDGYVVVHAFDMNGELVLTPPLGLTYLTAGTHESVTVDLDPALLEEYGYSAESKDVLPMLHIDDGDQAYEFPDGPDVPVMVNEEMVVANLAVSFPGMMGMMQETGGMMDEGMEETGGMMDESMQETGGMMDESDEMMDDMDGGMTGGMEGETGGMMETGGMETGGMEDEMSMVENGILEVDLSGSQEVPPVMTDATGSATVTLRDNAITVQGDFANASSPISAAHIHLAAMGENGDVIIPLNVTTSEDGLSGILSGEGELTDEQLEAARMGNLYINVHSEMHPGGELRGQILTETMMGMMMDMTPSLSVSAQTAMDSGISLDSVTLAEDGFVVVHAYDMSDELVLTPPLGLTYLTAGTHENVMVELDAGLLEQYGYGDGAKNVLPMVHVDDGDQAYEFPDGPDVPVMVNEEMVVANLELTLP